MGISRKLSAKNPAFAKSRNDKHTNNYGDIVWWDMLFGTYSNPKEFLSKCGFDPEKEEKLLEMLQFKDVHK